MCEEDVQGWIAILKITFYAACVVFPPLAFALLAPAILLLIVAWFIDL